MHPMDSYKSWNSKSFVDNCWTFTLQRFAHKFPQLWTFFASCLQLYILSYIGLQLSSYKNQLTHLPIELHQSDFCLFHTPAFNLLKPISITEFCAAIKFQLCPTVPLSQRDLLLSKVADVPCSEPWDFNFLHLEGVISSSYWGLPAFEGVNANLQLLSKGWEARSGWGEIGHHLIPEEGE